MQSFKPESLTIPCGSGFNVNGQILPIGTKNEGVLTDTGGAMEWLKNVDIWNTCQKKDMMRLRPSWTG